MWQAALRVLCRKKVASLSHSRLMLILCLIVVSGVVLAFVVDGPPQFCHYPGGRRIVKPLEIPYKSAASVYRQNAAYVAPLPVKLSTTDAKADSEDAGTPPLSQQQPPRGVQTRTRRQEVVEKEIEAYLTAHGIHRERHPRVRFMVVANRVDPELCAALGSAALGGYSVPVSGFDAPYSHITRYKNFLSFAEREGLDDNDIIVKLDSDIVWSGADFVPFLSKFARFSPEKEADLDVAAVRAWEDYGEKKAPLFMKELQAQAEATGDGAHTKRPAMQMAPVITNGEEGCWWGQHSEGFAGCGLAFTAMDHLIEVARNHVSSYDMTKKNSFVSERGSVLHAGIREIFPGARRWMADDMLRQPNASSPYTTKAQRRLDDPLFYHPTVVSRSNPTTLLNGGLQVFRVWALRRLTKMISVYASVEKPVSGEKFRNAKAWACDQGLMGELYTRSRLFEVEHNLLTGPPPSARTPPVPYDPRFGPPGLIGIDRRSEMVMLGSGLRSFPNVFRRSAYVDRHIPKSEWPGLWVPRVQLGRSDPKEERLGALVTTRSGALVTPPLVWRSATQEDGTRGYVTTAEYDPDVVRPPFIHYAGGTKLNNFREQRHLYSWLVAARYDRRARQAFNKTLSEELVELWYEKERVYVEYSRICNDITELPLW